MTAGSLDFYLCAITLITAVTAVGFLAKAHAGGLHYWQLALIGVLSLLAGASGCGAGKPAGDVSGDAAFAAADGFFEGNSTGITHSGCDPDHANEHSKH